MQLGSFKLTSLVILVSLVLSSCGDLYTKVSDEEKTSTTSFSQANKCHLNTKALSLVMKKNIEGDLECLRSKLHMFIQFVETERRGHIAKVDLIDFVENSNLDNVEKVVKTVDFLYDLNFLLFGNSTTHISQDDLDTLVDFVIFFNKNIWKVYGIFKRRGEVGYSQHVVERELVFEKFSLIADKLKSISVYSGKLDHNVSLDKILLTFFERFPDFMNRLRSVLYLKEAFLGSTRNVISRSEFLLGLDLLPHLMQIGYDLFRIKDLNFHSDQKSLLNFFLTDIENALEVIFPRLDRNRSLFSLHEFTAMMDFLAPDLVDFNLSDYPKEMVRIKEMLNGGDTDEVYADDLENILNVFASIFREGIFHYSVYEEYAQDLDSRLPINHDFSDYETNNSMEDQYLRNFARIINTYKFFKGERFSPIFTTDFYRNPNGVFEILIIENVVKQVMLKYGRVNEDYARLGYDMTLDQTLELIKDFKWFLKDYGIIKIGRVNGGEIQSIAEKFVLLSTLFQYQSNGCEEDEQCLEIPEATEFLVGLFTSVSVKDFFVDKMMEYCADSLDEYDRIAPRCFRNQFRRVLDSTLPEGVKLSEYFPMLDSYLEDITSDLSEDQEDIESYAYLNFITETEAFTRSCMHYDDAKTEEIPLTGEDAFSVFAGLVNVESTLLRFDTNGNNVLDGVNGSEVMDAYDEVYKGAMMKLVPDSVPTRFVKYIYLYMIIEGEAPDSFGDIWDIIRIVAGRRADATRATISTVLKTLGEQSSGSDHPYKCDECFRDPTIECEPEGEPWRD